MQPRSHRCRGSTAACTSCGPRPCAGQGVESGCSAQKRAVNARHLGVGSPGAVSGSGWLCTAPRPRMEAGHRVLPVAGHGRASSRPCCAVTRSGPGAGTQHSHTSYCSARARPAPVTSWSSLQGSVSGRPHPLHFSANGQCPVLCHRCPLHPTRPPAAPKTLPHPSPSTAYLAPPAPPPQPKPHLLLVLLCFVSVTS